MKQAKLNIKLLETAKDCKDFQVNSNGGFLFPVGTVIVSGCIMGEECATLAFVPNADQSGVEQFAEWQCLNVLGKMEHGKKK